MDCKVVGGESLATESRIGLDQLARLVMIVSFTLE